MLLDIPANLELIVATPQGVRTLRRGDDLNSDDVSSGATKIMGMRMIGASQTAVSRAQSANQQINFGAITFNVGASIFIYQWHGALALMLWGLLWLIGATIFANTKRELDSLAHLRKSSAPSAARTAGDSPESSTE